MLARNFVIISSSLLIFLVQNSGTECLVILSFGIYVITEYKVTRSEHSPYWDDI